MSNLVSRGKRAGEPLESRWLPPPIDTRNTRGVISELPASWEGTEYLMEGSWVGGREERDDKPSIHVLLQMVGLQTQASGDAGVDIQLHSNQKISNSNFEIGLIDQLAFKLRRIAPLAWCLKEHVKLLVSDAVVALTTKDFVEHAHTQSLINEFVTLSKAASGLSARALSPHRRQWLLTPQTGVGVRSPKLFDMNKNGCASPT
ncbi:hypothetical protein EVAR_39920_1 [Eumeta japonica]|uniref:Uncharacterized protein n=1 Tax=Eumeta variegata TaxID=151549 RepID=A0A4C1WMF0_EUMVA|nr:hypothetical protein EVAR_39920_1 [Eumeta japonica]